MKNSLRYNLAVYILRKVRESKLISELHVDLTLTELLEQSRLTLPDVFPVVSQVMYAAI